MSETLEEKQAPPQKEQLISDSEMGVGKEEKKGSETREYVVFEMVSQDTFKIVRKVMAHNADEARKSIGEQGLKDTFYAAVTSRSWKPEKPKVTTRTVISFE